MTEMTTQQKAEAMRRILAERAAQSGDARPGAAFRQFLDERERVKEAMPSADGLELSGRALRRGLEMPAVGAAQLVAGAVGADDTLATLHGYEERRRREDKPYFEGAPTAGILPVAAEYDVALPGGGSFSPFDVIRTGSAALPALVGSRLIAGAAPAAASLPVVKGAVDMYKSKEALAPLTAAAIRGLAALGLNVGAGAAGGAAIPLTAAEEAAGERKENATVGALFGLAPTAVQGGAAGLRTAGKVFTHDTPDAAIRRLADELGYSREAQGVGDPVIDFRRALENSLQNKAAEAREMFDLAELAPNAPPVRMNPWEYDTLTGAMHRESLGVPGFSNNPTVERIRQSMLDKQGEMSFGEARELQREIRGALRRVRDPDSQAAAKLTQMDSILSGKLDAWAADSAEAAEAMGAAKAADRFYAREVVPLVHEGPIAEGRGKLTPAEARLDRVKAYPNYNKEFENTLLAVEGAPLLRELVDRAPATREPLTRIWARNITDMGNTPSRGARMLGNSPLDVLVDNPSYHRQALRIGDALSSQSEDMLPTMIRKIPGVEVITSGVLPRAKADDIVPTSNVLNSALASWLLGSDTIDVGITDRIIPGADNGARR